jgi:L-proline amide hydrolase
MIVTPRTVPFRGHETWTRTTTPEAPSRDALPVVVLHGGPGLAHDYLENLADLADTGGRTVVHYDQLGCGRSTHLPSAPDDLWTPELFVEEFLAVVDALGLDRYHLAGHAWGGMLGSEIALRRPAGLISLTLLNTPASMDLWVRGAATLRRRMDPAARAVLESHEDAGSTDAPAYRAATDAFMRQHICRLDPWPAAYTASLAQLDADQTVYAAMTGNHYFVPGNLRDWSVVDRLEGIAVPTLVLAGEFDEATPTTWAPFVEHVPDVRSMLVPDTSHCTHLEAPEIVLGALSEFMARHDG